MGYPVQNLPPTLSTSDSLFTGKSNAFFAYTPYDSGECQVVSYNTLFLRVTAR